MVLVCSIVAAVPVAVAVSVMAGSSTLGRWHAHSDRRREPELGATTMNDPSERSWWGWGLAHAALSDDECRRYGALLPGLPTDPITPPTIADLDLRTPRIHAPTPLADRCSVEPVDRAGHTYGKAYRDVVRALAGQMDPVPDVVAYPRRGDDVVAILDWASDADVAVVPYGAGSSVVGGTEYAGGDHAGVVSMDLSRLDQVLEIDRVSRQHADLCDDAFVAANLERWMA